MSDINDALDHQALLRRLTHELPIALVLAYAQLQPEQFGHRVRAQCPFHEDHDPSLEVWIEDDGKQRWGCWPCGRRGDVIDLLRWLWGLSFSQAVEAGAQFMLAAGAWSGPAPAAGSKWDAVSAASIWLDAFKHFDLAAADSLCERKGWAFGGGYLHGFQMCGTKSGNLIIPIHNTKHELVAMKYRALDGTGKTMTFPGSQLRGVLYGEEHDLYGEPLVICEGESDTWSVRYRVSKPLALGLPSGAGTPPQPFIERLAGRRVYLAFDGDEAGDQGAARWASALSLGSQVTRLELPRGYDLTSLGSVDWLNELT